MGQRTQLILLLLFIPYFVRESTAVGDYNGLLSVRGDLMNTPPNWEGSDPCGSNWIGISCTNSRVTSLQLLSMNLSGRLSREIELLSELQTLDLSNNKNLTGQLPPSIGSLKNLVTLNLIGCGFYGSIPYTIGNLHQLTTLSLNNNGFSGSIPASIGSLSNIDWLDLAVNQLTGTIPVSPGLDNLLQAKHFHLDNNKLSGEIPPQLFRSNMKLLHLILNGNNLNGSIPETIGSVWTLEVIRLDRNSLSGTLPSNLNNLVNVHELYLSNNKFIGSIPNLTGMSLTYVDMSNNSFTASDMPPWFSTLQSLTTLVMENTQLQGPVNSSIFSLPNLQTVTLRNNNLSGTLEIGTSYSRNLQLVDLQNNSIAHKVNSAGEYNKNLILVNNPICNTSNSKESYCTVSQSNTPPYSTPSCLTAQCSSDQISRPNCICAYAYSGTLVFRAPNFSDLGISSYYIELQSTLMQRFKESRLPVDSVSLHNPIKDSSTMNLNLSLDVFPSGQDRFNRTGILNIGSLFSDQTFKPPEGFGPYYFLAYPYGNFAASIESKKSLSKGVIIGVVAGGTILLLLLLLAGVYALRQKRRAERASEQLNPFAHWDPNNGSGGIPQLKGARSFSFEELKKYTNKFSEANSIGSGGYGKVYRGILPTGQLIAIKRAQTESMQGGVEFKTEIELLSRVHHKNLVSLVGFCFDQGEQMLVYEYVPNGTLKEGLSGKSGIRLDWIRRLKVALGAARGLAYLHELANPPIIHRDIKSTNILLDERLNAKVADFGLSKLMGDAEIGHVTTQVKGTMGYLDPEYYMTQQLTEKSDVYSFGVVLLELITARMPIQRGKYIVRVVQTAMDRTKVLYNLHEILDPAIGLQTSLKGLEKFVDLAMRCVEESGAKRPAMGMVVKEIENIMELAGLNPNAESATTSESYDVNKENAYHPYSHPYSNEGFEYSGVYPTAKIEPH
ncbi:leucine-rich repeat receptor protein kinase HPCA1-like isoform X3 [Alnus glutinosa]|uniref:leucine-rich repeat receptor protein kinase HPCA1-like isoform X3 n=1 Tax=Alnus glutinosa TaxID=3517 RepID=UPI002D78D6D9|nr:leucine-rich repeat receptor protein kinase HPCA1-like isoform X3 [Alnus glutinosa]